MKFFNLEENRILEINEIVTGFTGSVPVLKNGRFGKENFTVRRIFIK